MPLWIITFFLGVSALPFCNKLPNLYWLLTFIAVFCFWLFSPQKIKKLFFKFLMFVLGFCWALIYTRWITSWSLSSEFEGKKMLVTGYVTAPPVTKSHRISFEFQTATINEEKKRTKLKLSWYDNYSKINAGDKWQLMVRLKRPHGVLNPGGFDAEKHMLVHGIRATGYVVDAGFNKVLESYWYRYPLSRIRQFLIDKMEQVLNFDELTPVIIAFVTGAEDKITQDQWRVMRDTGTSYLVAISGLHVGLVASLALGFVGFLWKFSKYLPLILPAREAGVVVGLLIGFIYGAVSGLSIPTQRALVMLVMFSLVVLGRRYTQSWNAWLWSLFLVLIINPLAVLTIGFWLSFVAVAAIIFVSGNRINNRPKISKKSSLQELIVVQNQKPKFSGFVAHLSKFWRMQWTVTIALLPLTLLFFQQFSLVTIVANLIAMPGVCLVVVPISLFGALCLLIPGNFGGWILWIGAKILYLIWWWLTVWADFSNSSWNHPIYNCWVLVAISVGAILLLTPKGFPAKYLGLLWLLPLFFYKPQGPKDNEFWFTMLDVGQGLAAVVQTKNHILLYDTGPKFFEQDAGTSVVVPYLRMQGIKTIDTMVVSHGDMDHSGGARSVLSAFPVSTILTSAPEKFIPYGAQFCVAGQSWHWDGVDFQMLFPYENSQLTGNNGSCVLKVTGSTNSVLLTGDIERSSEEMLVENYSVALKSTVLVAPHHGSATSSTAGLVAAVMPQYVLFPTGYRNRFHFPNKKVSARYLEKNAILLNAPQTGAIIFKFGDKSDILSPVLFREFRRRFWHD